MGAAVGRGGRAALGTEQRGLERGLLAGGQASRGLERQLTPALLLRVYQHARFIAQFILLLFQRKPNAGI